MKAKLPEAEDPEGFVMTPMIDVTFQLLVFFMLVLDISQAQIVQLELPSFKGVEKVNWEDSTLMIVNIDKKGVVTIAGKEYLNPPKKATDMTALNSMFKKRLSLYPEPGKPQFAKYPALIRADKDSDWENIQKVQQSASKEGGVTLMMYSAYKAE